MRVNDNLAVFEQNPKFFALFTDFSYLCSPNTAQGPQTYANMLLRFSVTNYRSFGHEMTLDLTASNGIKDLPGSGVSPIGNTNNKVLNAVAIYGANSSGKSNLLMAIGTMRGMVRDSVRLNDSDTLPYEPFLLSTREQHPTRFEAVYYEPDNKATITYGFEYTEEAIKKEWLVAKWPSRSEKRLFLRTPEGVEIDERSYPEGGRARELPLNGNRLFLSLAGQVGGSISNGVINWFQDQLRVISGIEDTYSHYTRRRVYNSPEAKNSVQQFLGKMKLGFDRIDATKVDFESMGFPPGMPKELIAQIKRDPIIQVSSIHNVYSEDGQVARTESFDLDSQESAGTNKIFSLSGPLLDALAGGITLLIDELDSQMHPMITWRLVQMFNSATDNPHCAQLVFTTHDTNLLSNELFRRDQIWFTEKDPTESTALYPLTRAHENSAKINHTPRNDSNYQKNYIAGLYGALPFLRSRLPE